MSVPTLRRRKQPLEGIGKVYRAPHALFVATSGMRQRTVATQGSKDGFVGAATFPDEQDGWFIRSARTLA